MKSIAQLHASCVAIGNKGVLLLGDSSVGKSDLSLRLIDRGAKLVADDHVEITQKGKQVIASAPKAIAGLLEVRGVGIFKTQLIKHVPLLLVVQLTQLKWIERLPYPEPYACLGLHFPQIRMWGFEPSAPIKVEMAMAALQDGSMTVGAFKE